MWCGVVWYGVVWCGMVYCAACSIVLLCAVHRTKAQDPRERPVVEFVSVESVQGTRPANKALICEWFKAIERPKGVGMDQNGTIFDWFHGQCVE